MNFGSHVIAGVTTALKAQQLSALDPSSWRIVSYSDTATLGTTPTFSLTLPGRAAVTQDGHRRPWREVLSVGDTIQTGGWIWDGQGSPPRPRTLCDGLITSVSDSETWTPQGYTLTTTLGCEGLQNVLENDSVAWWMYYGSAEGWLAARGKLLVDDLSGKVDKILSNYMKKVVLHQASWSRGGKGLDARLGFNFSALSPSSAVDMNFAIAEGTHWSIMQEILDPPLHEMYTAVQPGDYAPPGDFVGRPTLGAEKALIGQLAGDNGRTWLMVRPAPFPYASDQGKPILNSWKALPLHDFTGGAALGSLSLSQSLYNVRNFFMVYPAIDFLDEQVSFTAGIAVKNGASIQRYSYRPLKSRTHLVLGKGNLQDPIRLARALTWRVAAQFNRMDEYQDATFDVPFAPEVQPGDRCRFTGPLGDQTKGALLEGYVTSRTHSGSPEQGYRTQLSVSRVLPASVYDSEPQWFVKNLAPVQVAASSTAPSAKPTTP